MENRETLLLQRYFRKTPAHPEGSVVHHGDCDFFSIRICTCGLHRDLMVLGPERHVEHYPLFDVELAEYERVRESLMHAKATKGTRKKKA